MVRFKYIFEAMEETEAIHILTHLPKIRAGQIIQEHGSAIKALGAIDWQLPDSWKKDKELIEKEGIALLSYHDKEYPSGLKMLANFPLLLYVKGKLLDQDQGGLAVIGTRNCSIYGLEMSEHFAERAASYGLTIISGLARGIDTAAHKGALKNGRTIAFIGSGLSNLYPKENAYLAEAIAEKGAVISTFFMQTPPDKHHFPIRNQWISGLSKGLLLIEAPLKSGAMITMQIGEKQGKHCFALPGRIDMENFRGNHFLLKNQKAQLVEKVEEMVSILLPGQFIRKEKKVFIPLNDDENKLLAQFPQEEIHMETLIERSQLSVAKLNALLMGLVLKKIIREFPGKYYKKVI